MSTLYLVGQMNQLGDALETAGFAPDDVTKLRSFPQLGEIRSVLRGNAKILTIKHIIDCDADPHVPDGWEVEEHQKGGQFEWDPSRIALYLSDGQKNGKVIEGKKLRKELEGKPVLNANVLDYLFAHPELIPEEWKEKAVFFWGTVYRYSDGGRHVRGLRWLGSQWHWYYRWLKHVWFGADPAVLRT